MLEQRVRYITSGELLEDLTAALADQTIHDRVRFYAKFALLIIDEFGFDRIERSLCPQAASLWYKIIDARSQRVSTALVTNIDFESWADYLGDAPLGDGAAGSRRGRRHHREAERQILPRASRRRRTVRQMTHTANPLLLRPIRLARQLPGPLSSRETGPLFNRDQQAQALPASSRERTSLRMSAT